MSATSLFKSDSPHSMKTSLQLKCLLAASQREDKTSCENGGLFVAY